MRPGALRSADSGDRCRSPDSLYHRWLRRQRRAVLDWLRRDLERQAWALTGAVPRPKGTASPWLYGVSCRAAGRCVAMGLTDWNPASNGTLTGRAAAATWNGKAWTATPVAVPGTGDASGFATVACRPGTPVFCAAVGYRDPQNSG